MLQTILNTKHWFIDSDFATRWAEMIQHRIAQGKDLMLETPGPEVITAAAGISTAYTIGWDAEAGVSFYETEKGKVARIPLKDTMTAEGGLCSYGTKDLAAMLAAANEAPDYLGAVIVTDTPGGSAYSVEVLQKAIQSTTKPVVTWVEGMNASAGVWATSPSDKILAGSERFAVIGSIGAFMIHQNIAGALEKDGVKVEIIRAPQSTNKTKLNTIEPLTDELRAEVQGELKTLVNYFIQDMKAFRGVEDDGEVFTGKTYSAADALSLGLIDGIASLDEAIAEVIELHETRNPKQDNKMKLPKFLSFLVPAEGQTSHSVELSERLSRAFGAAAGEKISMEVNDEGQEILANLEAGFTGLEAQLEDAQTNIAELETAATENATALELANTTVTNLQAEVETLKKAPASNHTAVKPAEDTTAGAGEIKKVTGYKAVELAAKQKAAEAAEVNKD